MVFKSKRNISVIVYTFIAVVNIFVVFVGDIVVVGRRGLFALVGAERHIEGHIGIGSGNLVQILGNVRYGFHIHAALFVVIALVGLVIDVLCGICILVHSLNVVVSPSQSSLISPIVPFLFFLTSRITSFGGSALL